MVKLLGKLPEMWWSDWDERSQTFEDDGTPIPSSKNGITFGRPVTIVELLTPPAAAIGEEPLDIEISAEEAELLADLLLNLLKFEPDTRQPLDDVLKHSWFTYQTKPM